MDLSTIIALLVFSTSICYLLYCFGWKKGKFIVITLFGFLFIYSITIYFWGDIGKKYLAIMLILAVVIGFFIQKAKGKDIW